MAKQSEMISVANAAKILKISTVMVRDYINSGKLPAQRVGTYFVLKRADVMAFERPPKGRPRKRPAAK